ncbi:MAG: RsmB/NOP family class I SAM-dependent RNA methyltransferase [Promethearchaeota archaeon]
MTKKSNNKNSLKKKKNLRSKKDKNYKIKKSYKDSKRAIKKDLTNNKYQKAIIIEDYDLELDSFNKNYVVRKQNSIKQEYRFKLYPISEKAYELAEIFDYQPYMIERYIQIFGEEETIDLLKANESPNPIYIRINTLKTNIDSLLDTLKLKGYEFQPIKIVPYAFRLIENEDINSLKKQHESKQKSTTKYAKATINYQFDENEDNSSKFEMDFTRSKEDLEKIQWGSPQTFDSTKTRPSISEIDKDSVKIISYMNLSKTQIRINKNARKSVVSTLGSTHEYLMGKYYLQGLESMLAPFYLNPTESDLVLDMCAAPGSKTTQLAQIMNNKGRILAVESNPKRIKSLIYNLRRCKVYNTTVMLKDATQLLSLNIHPDKILLDAPCSGEGIIRNDPTRKRSKKPEDIEKLMNLQIDLLKTAVKLVKPGGYVMYSTCSIAPEENEFVIQSVLESYKKIKIVPIEDDFGMPGFIEVFNIKLSDELLHARRYFPHIHNTNGFFLCLLQKNK